MQRKNRSRSAVQQKNRISFSMNIYATNTSIFYVGKARNYNVPDVLNIISLHGAITIDGPGSNDICVKIVIIRSMT